MDILTQRQQDLYTYLVEHKNEWCKAKDIAMKLFPERLKNKQFFGSGVCRTITNYIQKINECSSIPDVIIFDRMKGVKVATKEEFYEFYLRRTQELQDEQSRLLKLCAKVASL